MAEPSTISVHAICASSPRVISVSTKRNRRPSRCFARGGYARVERPPRIPLAIPPGEGAILARKTVLVCDSCGNEVEEGKGAVLRVTYTDARRGAKQADLCDNCAGKTPGRAVARRGRRRVKRAGPRGPPPRRQAEVRDHGLKLSWRPSRARASVGGCRSV